MKRRRLPWLVGGIGDEERARKWQRLSPGQAESQGSTSSFTTSGSSHSTSFRSSDGSAFTSTTSFSSQQPLSRSDSALISQGLEYSQESGAQFQDPASIEELASAITDSGPSKDLGSPSRDHELDKDLCSRCASLEIEKIFAPWRKLPKDKPRYLIDLGELGQGAEQSPCSICRLFNAVKLSVAEYPGKQEYALYSTRPPFPYTEKYPSVLTVLNVPRRRLAASDSTVQVQVPQMEKIEKVAHEGFIACAITSKPKAYIFSPPARQIQAQSIDFDILRNWLTSCEKNHSAQCVGPSESSSEPDVLSLIDCEQRRVHRIAPKSSLQYCALSYVWGRDMSNNDQPISGQLPENLARTIEDAFTTTRELGLQWIWIDRYCIEQQGDHAKKNRQIEQMNLVYQNAYVTLIAAAGENAHSGLPGVSSRPRTFQPIAWLGKQHLVSTLADPRETIQSSVWMQRGWTYQESFFSRRRLVFTEQQVYFDCRAGTACELIDHFKRNIGSETHLFPSHDPVTDHPWAICDHLKNYCGRALSYESDAIRAFEGVLFEFENKKFPVRRHWGVPIMPPVVQSKRKRAEPTWSGHSKTEGFVAGLCWRNTSLGTRRPQFPSWSWAGWDVSLTAKVPEMRRGLQFAPEEARPLVFVQRLTGSPLDVDRAYETVLTSGAAASESLSKFILLTSWTILLEIRHFSGDQSDATSPSHPGPPGDGSGYFAVFRTKGRLLNLPVHLLRRNDADTQRAEPYFDSTAGKVLGVVLGASDQGPLGARFDAPIFILVVQKVEEYYERIGYAQFDFGALSRQNRKQSGSQGSLSSLWELCFRERKRQCLRLG